MSETVPYLGNFRGIVVSNNDPLVKGRVKVFVNGVYPDDFKDKPDKLPWAEPAMPLFGGSWTNEKAGMNSETGVTTIPHAGSAGSTGAIVWVFFEQGHAQHPIYFAACQAGPGWLSEHHNQHVVRTDNVTVRIDENPTLPRAVSPDLVFKFNYTKSITDSDGVTTEESQDSQQFSSYDAGEAWIGQVEAALLDNESVTWDWERLADAGVEQSTCKFDSYNSKNTAVSIGDDSTSQMPTRVDIEIDNPTGCGLNIVVNGAVNLKVTGSVYEEINGNKHETLIGNLYRKHVGDAYVVHEGVMKYEHTGDYSETTTGDKYVMQTGARQEFVTSKYTLVTQSDYTLASANNITSTAGGNLVEMVTGTRTSKIGGSANFTAAGDFTGMYGGRNIQMSGGAAVQMTVAGNAHRYACGGSVLDKGATCTRKAASYVYDYAASQIHHDQAAYTPTPEVTL